MEQLELNLAEATREIKEKLNTVAENFVFVGYRLRQILDTGVFADAGYTNIYDFAERELSLNATAVSRFMAINKKYSVDGYGPELREQFKGYGSSKLSEMLTMSEEDCAVIASDTPVKQIREYKNFLKEEPKEDPDQMDFREGSGEPEKEDGLKALLKDYFSQEMGMLRRILDDTATPEILQEQMNPTGVHNIRYKTAFLMLQDMQHGVMYREFGAPPLKLTWEELLERIRADLRPEYEAMAQREKERKAEEKAKKNAAQTVSEPKKEPVATSQTKEPPAAVEKEQGNVEPEPQIPGQMEVEDYPEIMPEKSPESGKSTLTQDEPEKAAETVEKEPEILEEPEKSGAQDEENTVKRLDLTMAASEVYGLVQKADYETAVQKCEELLILLKRKVGVDEE
ncbi:hypothetical protein H8Z76_02905 [Roseburia sp. BX0805]|uniref:DUF3102 domain-containing protein n=1 Tax=Roseburia yibonii TaxID=2763063 RepID=A0ABR7I7U5_9FIRM|nr:hypothetical protein [Roseburia yibonii]MBC5752982.1 hypothetical protein [Roseburia yibonii]